MDINIIKYFVSVAQTLNFSEAARQNFVSQSTVSRGIIEMEKEFGANLFTRTKRNVKIKKNARRRKRKAVTCAVNFRTPSSSRR